MAPLTLVTTHYQQHNATAPRRLRAQVRYVSRGPLFDRQLGTQTAADARALLAAHGLAPAWDGPVAYHRLILSLQPVRGLDDVAVVRAFTAVVLDDLAALLDRQPVWVAGVHTDTDHRHAHILIAGGDAERRSVEIRERALAALKRRVEARAQALAG
jgi:hypothetical protein